jgi:hypothetical protein
MTSKTTRRVSTNAIGFALLTFVCALLAACDQTQNRKPLVKSEQKELEPRVVVPAAEAVVSIHLRADEGFLGGPLDEMIADADVIDAVMKLVRVIQSSPRQVGDVHQFPKKGQMTIISKTGVPLELRLSEGRAIHFVSAYSMNTEALAEIVRRYRNAKK